MWVWLVVVFQQLVCLNLVCKGFLTAAEAENKRAGDNRENRCRRDGEEVTGLASKKQNVTHNSLYQINLYNTGHG